MKHHQYQAEMRRLSLDTIVGAVVIVWLLGIGMVAVMPHLVAVSVMFDRINAVVGGIGR